MSQIPPSQDPHGNLECPECGSDVWDNREKKASGAFNPKRPDFACKNRSCDYAYWHNSKGSGGGGSGQRRSSSGGSSGGSKKKGGPSLAKVMYVSHKVAQQVVEQLEAEGFEFMGDQVAIPEIAGRLFTAHMETGRHFTSPKKKKAPPPPPPPPPPPVEEEIEEYGDDDLPF